jgi:two-component system, NtrC family, nitrogen regulation response regulator GlnG
VSPALYKPVLPDKLHLEVVSGPDRGRSLTLRRGERYIVGKSPTCELPVTDALVSRQHLRLDVGPSGVTISDLASRNGSFFQGARFETIVVSAGASVVIGETELMVTAEGAKYDLAPSDVTRFGDLIGTSVAMRRVFALLERVAPSDSAVLLQGETGSGKELAAEAIHRASGRREGPFVVCDLAASAPTLIESELFGHVKGAFTGADRDRDGSFRQAEGGTIFLDEIGELDLSLQPRLLRALERKQVKPVGASAYRPTNVRLITATNRDLAAEVRAGRFRKDLYHRLAVMRIELPPLRERPEDVPPLVELFLERAAASGLGAIPKVPPATMAALAAHDWPGNVRELHNVLERAMLIASGPSGLTPLLLGLESATEGTSGASKIDVDAGLTFKEAKDRLIGAWEREYLVAILEKAGRNVSLAARRAGMARVYLHELMKKHGLER